MQKHHDKSPLTIDQHYFTEITCKAGVNTDSQDYSKLHLETTPSINQDENDPLLWKVLLGVSFGPEDKAEKTIYTGYIEVYGIFKIDDGFPEKNREALIRVTAISILYGACREMVANITARSIYGVLSLPSISFRQQSISVEDSANEESEETLNELTADES